MDEHSSPFQDSFISSPFRHFPLFSLWDPDYSCLQDRIHSFKNWPRYRFQAPALLAKAGFYMLNSDVGLVKCFKCGVELRRCYVQDPLDQHERYSPLCEFVRNERDINPREPKSEDLTPLSHALDSRNFDVLRDQCEPLYIKIRCKVCLTRVANMLLIGCSHLCVCYECYLHLQPIVGPKCPVCRCPFRNGIQVHM